MEKKQSDKARRKAFNFLVPICKCGVCKKLQVHHIDGNRDNNWLYNLEIVCPKCHKEIHGVINKQFKVNSKYQPGTSKRKKN